MKKSFIYIIAAVALVFTACHKEHGTVKDLEGTWKITSFEGKPSLLTGVIMPDSILQTFTFKECKNAYTANCRCLYVFQNNDSTHVEADMMYTIKGEEIDFIGIYSNTAKWVQKRENKPDSVRILKQSGNSTVPLMSAVPNFTRLYLNKRYFIKELTPQQSFMIERFGDSLQVRAEFIGN